MKRMGWISIALLLVSTGANANTIKYNFSWSGTSGYSMTGYFTYLSASAVDGAIRDTEVTSLFFEGFLNDVSIGTNSTARTLANFNFNFNSTTGQFFLGGTASGLTGQNWNPQGTGLGFIAGGTGSTLSLNGPYRGFSNNPSNLTATLAVPEPGTLALLGIGLLSLGLIRRRAA